MHSLLNYEREHEMGFPRFLYHWYTSIIGKSTKSVSMKWNPYMTIMTTMNQMIQQKNKRVC